MCFNSIIFCLWQGRRNLPLHNPRYLDCRQNGRGHLHCYVNLRPLPPDPLGRVSAVSTIVPFLIPGRVPPPVPASPIHHSPILMNPPSTSFSCSASATYRHNVSFGFRHRAVVTPLPVPAPSQPASSSPLSSSSSSSSFTSSSVSRPFLHPVLHPWLAQNEKNGVWAQECLFCLPLTPSQETDDGACSPIVLKAALKHVP